MDKSYALPAKYYRDPAKMLEQLQAVYQTHHHSRPLILHG
jgi:hypothetical protein